MRIAIFGLGYVGCVTGACLARMGHEVVGVDVSETKVRMINEGHSPIVENGMERAVAQTVRAKKFRATLDPAEAMKAAELSMVTVGTPSRKGGEADVSHVLDAARDIGRALHASKRFQTVAVRSTVPPGTIREAVLPALERHARRKAGRDFGLCFHPEFLREGSSIYDFFHPPMTVIGALNPRSAKQPVALWGAVRAPLFLTSLEAAELLKYASNAFHALKVSFANEIGSLAKAMGINGHELMKIFVRDTKLNISPLYLEPGFAFGGSCLPKDLRALEAMSRRARVETPLLASVLGSNAKHLRRAVQLVVSAGRKRVGVLGLAFKSETDDLRESPACALVKQLLAARREVRIYEPHIRLERLLGANRAFVERELPQLPQLLVNSAREVLKFGDVIVLAGRNSEFESAIHGLRRSQILVELVRPRSTGRAQNANAAGMCW